jgi:hypothetical protein
MPSITMIGNTSRGARVPTALPAESRSLGRFLRLLQSPQVASKALLDSLSQAPPSSQRDEISENLRETLEPLQKLDLTPKEFADRMSIAAELAIRTAFSKDGSRKGNDTDDDDASSISPHMTEKMATKGAAVVSDSSTAGSEEDAESLTVVEDDSVAEKRFWAVILESIHLQVTSRTTTVWGRKKIYEIYQLSGTSSSSLNSSPGDIAKAVEREFRIVFHGGGEDQSGCRSYALMSGNSLYIQLNIGKFYDFQDERNRSTSGEKKKKKGNEFTFIVEPGSSLVAVSASRAPSKSRFTKFVLAALDAALTSNSTATEIFNEGGSFQNVSLVHHHGTVSPHSFFHRVTDMIPKRVGDWSGTEPQELLESARAAQTGQAVGRFAHFAAESVGDPLMEMHSTFHSSLVDRSAEQGRLEVGAQHGRSMAQLSKNCAPAALVAANAGGTLVDLSAVSKNGRKRARDFQLGRAGDCPRLQRLCWKWTGETVAASACWLQDGGTIAK